MENWKQRNPSKAITTSVVAALLGLLLIVNAAEARPDPLRILDVAIGALFIMVAIYEAAKREG